MTINDIAHYPWPQRWHRAPAGTEPLECGPQRQLDGGPLAHSNTQACCNNTMPWAQWEACISPVLITYNITSAQLLTRGNTGNIKPACWFDKLKLWCNGHNTHSALLFSSAIGALSRDLGNYTSLAYLSNPIPLQRLNALIAPCKPVTDELNKKKQICS